MEEGREAVRALARPIASVQQLDALLGRIARLGEDCGDDDDNSEARRAWLVEAQQTLVTTVAVDWADALPAGSARREQLLLTSCFLDGSGAKACATMASVSRLLMPAATKARLHPQSRALLEAIITRLVAAEVEAWSISAVVDYVKRISHSKGKGQQGAARAELVWKEFAGQACALAERWSNVAQGGPEQDILSRRAWTATLARQLDAAVVRGAQGSRGVARLAVLLTKMVRVGYVDEDGFRGTLLARMADNERVGTPGEAASMAAWAALLSRLADDDTATLLEQLVAKLDSLYSAALVSSKNEQVRAGLEGARFLSSEAAAYTRLASRILGHLLVGRDGDGDGDDDDQDFDSDSDEAGVEEARQKRWTELALARQHMRSPLCACALVQSLQAHAGAQPATVQAVVDAWSAERRIKAAPWDGEAYLSTLVIALLASSSSSSSSPSSPAIAQLSTNARFIRGVSAHLEHPAPRVRRMGMLVAELVSAQGPSSGRKPLSFGSSMWDGRGEGREEARVLRALYHSWPHRSARTEGDDGTIKELALSLFKPAVAHTSAEDTAVVVPLPKKQRRPKTRQLPARVAPRRRGSLEQQDDGGDEQLLLPSLSNVAGRQRKVFIETLDKSSDEEGASSSSSSASSSSSLSAGSLAGAGEREKEVQDSEGFGMGVPEKKRRKRPVYIHELAPLLREKDREANKIALRYADVLVRRKAGWGAEVDEQAIDLAYALMALQDNFSLKAFDERRTRALVSLLVASPRNVAPCLVEQYFNSQYSIAQRIAMLNALAFASRELAGLDARDSQARDSDARMLAEGLAQTAIAQARERGHEAVRGPASHVEAQLSLQPKTAGPASASLIQPFQASQASSQNGQAASYTSVGPSLFIFPLLTRFQLHLSDALARASRQTARHHARPSSLDSNLYSHMLVCPFLDTLAVLVDPSALSYVAQPDAPCAVLEFCLFVDRWLRRSSPSSSSSFSPSSSETIEAQDRSMRASNASLCLVAIQGLSDSPSEAARQQLLHTHSRLLADVGHYASASFEAAEQAGDAREARCCAAILLRLHELRSAS
ncbi:hypothetical protein FA10DRAFT_282327 [Acaromyces ingoldii]|uniref:Telomere length regulation protein conserved domain-containing protein n=1 Tax=Acaromyces ingoldii TaxID=215250 RepID=A0A316YU67_9BASI|nr:hypothetical protein FA10DRAFT_282327 [Acaromyces ingoldii]PWN92642.1 hypothetical protein FA10DRAFT_282327 [Acaromyces ingoldii]